MSPATFRAGRTVAAAVVAAFGVSALYATPAAAAPRVVLSVGHVDAIDVAYEAGAFALSVHDETNGQDVERDPESVTLKVLPASAVTVPADPDYSFLGSAGRTVWVLPEVEDESLLWPGLSAAEIESGVFAGDKVNVVFSKVVGPDGFSLFDTRLDGGPNLLVDSEDRLPDVVPLTVGRHRHASWAFEAPGTYRVTYRVRGTLAATGATVSSPAVTLRFVVQG